MTAAVEPVLYQAPRGNVTFGGVLASEWVKLRSLRSTVWSLVAAVGMLVGFALLFSFAVASRWASMPPARRAEFDPTRISLNGVFLAQLAIGVLGVLIIGGEFSTGMIRSSVAAVPRRLPVLWAKAVVFGLVTLVLMVGAALAAFTVGQRVLAGQHIQTTLGAPGVTRAVLGAAAYLTLIGLLGLGLGALLRNSAAAISTLVGAVLVVPILVNFLPSDWQVHIARWLPSAAGESMMTVHPTSAQLTAGAGAVVLVAYVVVVGAAGAISLARRDV